MDFKKIQKLVHKLAVKKGWWAWEASKSDTEAIMLVVTELAEAVEEIRNNKPPVYNSTIATPHMLVPTENSRGPLVRFQHGTSINKPEGTLIELADAVIRIMDLCEKHKWDLEKAILMKHEYNKTRPMRHGGKLI
jgi:NTP pyrophosphatase (non-canonical NTP hydrolase)